VGQFDDPAGDGGFAGIDESSQKIYREFLALRASRHAGAEESVCQRRLSVSARIYPCRKFPKINAA
jgi:hypothetical protein